jgi:hypothetical protein
VKYMLLIYDNPDTREIFSRDESLGAEIDSVFKQIKDSGEFVDGEGLADPSHTKTIRPVDGAPAITDGPFAEAKEHLGGYMIVDCESAERAAEIAALWPSSRFAPIEVRPFMEQSGTEM